MTLTTRHYAALGTFLTSFALLLSSLDHWEDATSVRFVASVIANVGSILLATFSGDPRDSKQPDAIAIPVRDRIPTP